MRMSVLAMALTMVLGCRTAAPGPPAPRPVTPAQGIVSSEGGVYTWVSSPWTFSTTSYAIDAKDGLILVDAQFLPKDAVRFADDVERASGKKAVAAVVLHANPDKFNGTAALQARGIRVLTSSQVAALIPAVHEKRLLAFGERYKPDYPLAAARPESFGDHDVDLALAGTRVKLHVVGAGCSEAHVILEHDHDVFAGDLVANGAHSWLEIGKTDEWLERLDEMTALSPARVFPGRGLPGGPELLDVERDYLHAVIEAVAAEHPHGEPDDKALARIKRALIARFPSLRFSVFLDIGLPAEWRRQAGGPR